MCNDPSDFKFLISPNSHSLLQGLAQPRLVSMGSLFPLPLNYYLLFQTHPLVLGSHRPTRTHRSRSPLGYFPDDWLTRHPR